MRSRGDVFQYGPEVFTASECEALCARTKECNAWRFCADATKGCGAGCHAFASSPSTGAAAFPRNHSSSWVFEEGADCGPWPESVCRRVAVRLTNHSSSLLTKPLSPSPPPPPPPPHLPPFPVPSFDALGPYNLGLYGSPCHYGCGPGGFLPPEEAYGYSGKCRGGKEAARFTDQWAAGVCSLMRLAPSSSSPSSSSSSSSSSLLLLLDEGRGWVGGTIEKPCKCANVSAEACERCAEAAAAAAATGGPKPPAKRPGFGVAAAVAGEAACLACSARRTMPAWDVITGHDMARVECQGADEQRRRDKAASGRAPPFQVRSSCGAEAAALDCLVSREATARRCAGFGAEDVGVFSERTCRFVWPQADGAARPLMEG